MRSFSHQDVRAGLPWPYLIDALRKAFAEGCEQPERQHFDVGTPAVVGNLLIMPAWQRGSHVGVKLVTVFPENSQFGLPAVASTYTLFDGQTGSVLAQIDGGELTARRTAAASVLAASFLARRESRTLLVLGTGRVSRMLAEAYCATFPIEVVIFWGRSFDKTSRTAMDLKALAPRVEATADLAAALARADMVTSATLSKDPIIPGRFLRDGTHVDWVGGFRPDMRRAGRSCGRRRAGWQRSRSQRIAAFIDRVDGSGRRKTGRMNWSPPHPPSSHASWLESALAFGLRRDHKHEQKDRSQCKPTR